MDRSESCWFQHVQSYLRVSDTERALRPPLVEAWNWFLRRFRPLLVRQAQRLWRVEAEDREQELWLFLIPRLVKFRYDPSRGPLDRCMVTLTRRAVSDAMRGVAVRRCEAGDEVSLWDLVGPDAGLEERLEQHERDYGMHEAIDRMRTGGWAEAAHVLERRWFDGDSLADIAHEMGRTPDHVRLKHAQACAKLKVMLLGRPWRGLLPEWAGDGPASGKP